MANNSDDSKKDSLLAETLKKVLASGSAGEVSKEIMSAVLGQVTKTKDDVTQKVTQEMITLIQKIDFVKEFSKFAENHKFKITAEIEITKKKDD